MLGTGLSLPYLVIGFVPTLYGRKYDSHHSSDKYAEAQRGKPLAAIAVRKLQSWTVNAARPAPELCSQSLLCAWLDSERLDCGVQEGCMNGFP